MSESKPRGRVVMMDQYRDPDAHDPFNCHQAARAFHLKHSQRFGPDVTAKLQRAHDRVEKKQKIWGFLGVTVAAAILVVLMAMNGCNEAHAPGQQHPTPPSVE